MATPRPPRSSPILDPDDVASLLQEGTVIIDGDQAKIRMHMRRFLRSSDTEYSHLPILPPKGTASDEHFETVPDHLISVETLEYIGLTSAVAAELWDLWSSIPKEETELEEGWTTFDSIFRDQIEGLRLDTWSEDDEEWENVMDTMGIDGELQNIILAPQWKEVRQTQSCMFWVLDTLYARYNGLKDVQETSRQRGNAARGATGTPTGSGSRSTTTAASGGAAGSSGAPGQRSASDQKPQLTPGISIFSPAVRENTPGNFLLFRAGHWTHMEKIFDEQGNVNTQRLTHIGTKFPGDFNAATEPGAIYMARDLDIARKYAAFKKSRVAKHGKVALLVVEIPNRAVESLNETELVRIMWPESDYTKLVWNCRRGDGLPRDMSRFVTATIVVGSICGKPNDIISKYKSHDKITEETLYKNDKGEIGVQWAFIGPQGRWFLGEKGENFRLYSCTDEDVARIEDEIAARLSR